MAPTTSFSTKPSPCRRRRCSALERDDHTQHILYPEKRDGTGLTSCRSTASSFSTLGAKSGGAERGPQRRSYTAPFIINLAIPVCIDCT